MVVSPARFAGRVLAPDTNTVTSVTSLGAGVYRWTFANSVTVTSGSPPLGSGYQIDGGGGFVEPIDISQGSPVSMSAVYSLGDSAGFPWRTVAPLSGCTPQAFPGQTGVTI